MWALGWDHTIILLMTFACLFPAFREVARTMDPNGLYDYKFFVQTCGKNMVGLWLFFAIFYEPLLTYQFGCTVGKKLCKLKVVTNAGKQLNFFHSLLRFFIKSMCITIPYVNIVILVICYQRQKQGKKVFWDEWIATNVVSSKIDGSIPDTIVL